MSFETYCRGCDADLSAGYHPFCPDCGAMSDVRYDLTAAKLHESANPYERYADLLPVTDRSCLPADAVPTPTIQAATFGDRIGVRRLYLKDETHLPTGTTKDRMAAIALPYLAEHGVQRFATSSTGNSSTSYAAAIGRLPDMTMYVVTAEAFRDRVAVRAGDPQVIDVVARDASFVDAFVVAAKVAAATGAVAETGFFNPGRREGLKLAWLEAFEQVPHRIDWYVQAVSSAMGVYGVAKGAAELHAMGVAGSPPKLLCVQQESCAPMVSAWQAGRDHIIDSDIVTRPSGIATAILRGDPTRAYPHVHRLVAELGGDIISVPESAIRSARTDLATDEGIEVCFSAATALAGLAAAVAAGTVGPDETVLVNLTGSDRPRATTSEATQWVDRVGDAWDVSRLA